MRNYLFLITFCFTLISCSSDQNLLPPEKEKVCVLAAHPKIENVSIYIDAIGTFQPSKQREVYSRASGAVEEIFVKEGDWVEKGTLLVKIETNLAEIKRREAKAQLEVDQINLKAAQRKAERMKELAENDLIAQAEWEEITTQVEKAKAIISLSEARLAAIDLEIAYSQVRAPEDGRVEKIDVHEGTIVSSAQTKILQLCQLNPISFQFKVTEQELAQITSEKQAVEIKTLCGPAFSKLCAVGAITSIDHQFDPKTGQITIEGEVANDHLTFLPGQIAKFSLLVAEHKDQLLIPQKAVRYNQAGPYVYLIDENCLVRQKQVVLGEEKEQEVIILKGIKAKDLVMTDGHLRAVVGAQVEVAS